MDRIRKQSLLLLVLIVMGFVLLVLAVAASRGDNIVKTPTAFDTGSSFTIRSGIHATFASGSIVDFTGATVTGLPYVNSTETSVADGDFIVFSGTLGKNVRKATPFEVFDYGPDDGVSFIPYWNTSPGTHIWDKLSFSDDESLGNSTTTIPSQRAIKAYVDGAVIAGGGVSAWTDLNFAGSNFTDIETHPTTLAGYGITDAQPVDGDLTSLASATTAGIYYKTGVSSSWAPVTIGAGLNLTTNTLSAAIAFTDLSSHPTTLAGYGITDAAGAAPLTNQIMKGNGTGGLNNAGFTMAASYAVGDVVVATGSGTLNSIPDVATGQVFASGGVGAGPGYTASPTVTNLAVNGGALNFSGNQTLAAWTTNGVRLKGTAGTFTDTTSSGTVANALSNKLGGNTIAAGSATTYTNYYSLFVADPVAGSNVTFTNKYALDADSLKVGATGSSSIASNGVLTTVDHAVLGKPDSIDVTNGTGFPSPIIVSTPATAVLTAGAPADIATITIPSWITRWRLISASSNFAAPITAAATMAGASFTCYTAAAAGGTQMTAAFNGPINNSTGVAINANSLSTFTTSTTLVIRQTANSVNAGTIIFSFTLYPVQ